MSRGRLRSLVAWTWFPHALLFAVALVLRVSWVLAVDRKGFAFNDALMYHSTAENLSQGHGYVPFTGGPTARWPPGLSTVLGGLYWLFGVHPVVGELFNAVVGAATVVLLMLIAERTLDRGTAIVAGAMLAVLPGPIMWTDVLVSETLYTALFVAAVLVLVSARPTWGWLVAFGVAVGVGALVRGEALTWLVLPVAMWWRLVPWRVLGRMMLVAVATAAVVMLPWIVRNAVVMDAFVPVATNASETLWSGHNEHATGAQIYPPADYDDRFDQTLPALELQRSKALRNDAIGYMVTHPLRELELVPLKLVHLNRGDSYVLDWVNAPGDGEAPPISAIQAERIGVVADLGYYGLLTLTVLGGIVLGRSFWGSSIGRIAGASFAMALFLYGFLYYGNYRYRSPYEPLMVLVAAAFVTRAFRGREFVGRQAAESGRIDRYRRMTAELHGYRARVRVDVLTAERPTWRGMFHTWAFWLAIPAGVLLILLADQPRARTAAAIYVATLLLAFGTSSAYHRLAKSYRARKIMQRADHSMIYLLIAGTYVPICLVALPLDWGVTVMSVVGAMALLGIALKMLAFKRLQWLSYTLYLVMGWAAVVATPVLVDHLTSSQLALMAAGGIAYTVGVPILLLRRPDPWPAVFGYHEIWHGFTVLAAALHFGAVALVISAN